VYFDVIGEAWNMVRRDLGTWVATALVSMVIYGVVYAVMVGAQMAVGLSTTGSIDATGSTNPGALGLNLVINVMTSIVTNGFYFIVIAGMANMAVMQLRGQTIGVGDFFRPFQRFGSVLATGMLVSLATVLGYAACIVPGVYLTGALVFSTLIAYDQNVGPVEALRRSFDATRGHAWMLFLLVFLLGIVSGLGLCACGVGLLFTLPIYAVGLGMHYHYFFPPVATGYGYAPQTPPMADR
jgi:uncharacterized membrane protein